VKTSITANYHYTLKKKNKSVDARLFYGTMYLTGNAGSFENAYYFRPSGGTGAQDYLYDYTFLGRSENDQKDFLSHQFTETDGAMKVYTPIGRDTWTAALNLKSSLPGKIPFRLFADLNMIPSAGGAPLFLYDAGIYLPIVKNMIEVYVPLLMSQDIKDAFYLNNPDLVGAGQVGEKDPEPWKRTARMIRFTFNIERMNPFQLVRNLSL
jgi:hypothetical protein